MENRDFALIVHYKGGGCSAPFLDLTFEQACNLMHYWSQERVRHEEWVGLAVINEENNLTQTEVRW
jgi:hypothetical protein